MAAPTEYYVDPLNGNDTTGNGTVGTPWKTTQKALNTITPGAGGDRINIMDSATDTLSVALSFVSYGAPTAVAPLIFQGYTTAAGDGGIGHIAGSGTINIINSTTIDYVIMRDMHFSNGGTQTLIQCDNRWSFISCEFEGSDFDGVIGDAGLVFINCQFHDITSDAIQFEDGAVLGCFFFNDGTRTMATAINQQTSSGPATLVRNIISLDSTSDGIFLGSAQASVINNTLYTTGTGKGIYTSNTTFGDHFMVIGNLIEGWNTGIDFNTPASETLIYMSNGFYDNVADEANKGDMVNDTDNEALGASPLAKSGSATTYSNRNVFFLPQDTGNVFNPAWPGLFGTKGAVQPDATAVAGGLSSLIGGGLVHA
jgi:hypothetical protein